MAQFFVESESIEVISEQEKMLLEKYRALPEQKRKALLELLQ